jgi:LysM repeat protein
MATNFSIKSFWIGLLFLQLISFNAFAQPSERAISKDQYIEIWKDEAMKQMVLHKVPASITLAQGILESAHGNSELAKYANNHFGIKCHDWKGETLHKDDDKSNECFRKYQDARESYEDHSKFLTSRSRYAELFKLDITDYKGWAHGLRKAGYATNPKYGDLLIDIIEKHNLHQYDKMDLYVAAEKPKEIAQKGISKPAIPSTPAINVHQVHIKNSKTKYIIAKEGDTFYKISKEFDLALWQLYKYNEYTIEDILKAGDIVYLQPKRNKAEEKIHTVKKGDTMKTISQNYGIKIKKLYKLNNLEIDSDPKPGTVIKLR